MSNTATYLITNFQKGDFMAWTVCSQCLSCGTITLKDDNTTYFTAVKQSPSTDLQLISQGSNTYNGGPHLRIEVSLPSGYNVKQCILSSNIVDDVSNIVGYLYNYCIEDSTDNDYNDYYVNLAAWHHKG